MQSHEELSRRGTSKPKIKWNLLCDILEDLDEEEEDNAEESVSDIKPPVRGAKLDGELPQWAGCHCGL